jgi:hypothetical protein
VTFVATVLLGMVVVPLALYLGNQGVTPAATASTPTTTTSSTTASTTSTSSTTKSR